MKKHFFDFILIVFYIVFFTAYKHFMGFENTVILGMIIIAVCNDDIKDTIKNIEKRVCND